MNTKITLISNDKNWMDFLAVEPMGKIASLPNVLRVAGLPDLLAGKTPIVLLFESGMLYILIF